MKHFVLFFIRHCQQRNTVHGSIDFNNKIIIIKYRFGWRSADLLPDIKFTRVTAVELSPRKLYHVE